MFRALQTIYTDTNQLSSSREEPNTRICVHLNQKAYTTDRKGKRPTNFISWYTLLTLATQCCKNSAPFYCQLSTRNPVATNNASNESRTVALLSTEILYLFSVRGFWDFYRRRTTFIFKADITAEAILFGIYIHGEEKS